MRTTRGQALPCSRPLLALFALSLLSASVAAAQESAPGAAPPPSEMQQPKTDAAPKPNIRATLNAINDDINKARQLLPAEVGGDVDAEAKALADIQAALDTAKKALTPELQAGAAAHAAVAANLADAESWMTHLSLSHDCNLARQAVLAAHTAGGPAGESKVRAFKTATDAFTAGAVTSAAADAAFFQAQFDKLAAREAELQSAGAAAAVVTKKAELDELAAEANAALAALQELNATVQPVLPAAVDRLHNAAKALAEVAPDAARYYQDELLHYRVEQQWTLEDPASFDAIAAVLGAAITVRGVNRGKRLTLKFRAKADQCYLLYARFSDWSGAESVESLTWEVAGRGAQLQEIEIRRTSGWKGLPLRGFCATRTGPATAKAMLAFDGRKNGLRYVVVEHARAQFPPALTTRLEIAGIDHCDADGWKALWLQPVPGTMAYVDGEPVVIAKTDDEFATYWTAGAPRPKRALLSRFVAAAPATLALSTKLGTERCPDGQVTGPIRSELADKISKCMTRIDKKYAPKWKKVERLKADGNAVKAEEMSQKLEAKVAVDQEKRCAPLEKRAAEAFSAAFEELRSTLPRKKPTDPTGRVDALRAYQAAPLTR